MNYFFCGIGGRGMNPLAQIMLSQGHAVHGSDRSYDMGDFADRFDTLKKMGVTLHPQDGSGVTENIDVVVVSTAVEAIIPDIAKAKDLGITIIKRAELLAQIANSRKTIAIGGTSGKTTVTGMVGHILQMCGQAPMMINGGESRTATDGLGNVLLGDGPLVIEADESDGTIELYTPEVAVVTNITVDHKPMEELRPLFRTFVKKAKRAAVLNANCSECRQLKRSVPDAFTFSTEGHEATFAAEDMTPQIDGITFRMHKLQGRLRVPGVHNVANALAAISACVAMGVSEADALKALETFPGIRRRLELVGSSQSGITVLDDFAHNPDKIRASLQTLRAFEGRLWVIFQLHGFGPAKMMRKDLVDTMKSILTKDDHVLLPEIYFVGGTVEKTISAADIVADLNRQGVAAHFFNKRTEIPAFLKSHATAGDRVLVMGARDDTLADFARDLVTAL